MRPAAHDPRRRPDPRILPRLAAVLVGGLLGLGLPAGCSTSNAALRKIAEGEQIPLGSPERAGDWPFWPESLRFVPLSRSVASSAVGGRSLELYVECLDVDGYATRASGHLVLELTCPSAEPTSRRLTIDLTDPKANRGRWDEVTGSYRLDVTAPFDAPPPPGTDIDCRVILFSADGRTPTATTRVKW